MALQRNLRLLVGPFALLGALVLAAAPAAAQTEPQVLISEIDYVSSVSSNHEFIELFNPTSDEIPLEGMTIEIRWEAGAAVFEIGADSIIGPESYFVLCRQGFPGPCDYVIPDDRFEDEATPGNWLGFQDELQIVTPFEEITLSPDAESPMRANLAISRFIEGSLSVDEFQTVCRTPGAVNLEQDELCTCGNGVVEGEEQCDRGSDNGRSDCGCQENCRLAPVGAPCGSATNTTCTDPDSCDGAGLCRPNHAPPGTLCPDGNLCNGTESCSGGACTSGVAVSCNDNNACTSDSCDPATGCQNVTMDGCCNDRTDCPSGNACEAPVCNGAPGGSCALQPISGCCLTANDCPDRPCQTKSCDTTANVCTYSAVSGCCSTDSECDDGNPCTEDRCQGSGGCENAPIDGCCVTDADCDDGNVCNGMETCEGNTCQAGTALDCEDGDLCTSDSCDPEAGCQNTQLSDCCIDDTDCDDSDPCTQDRCETPGGSCSPPMAIESCCTEDGDCAAGGMCTSVSCETSTNRCVSNPIPDCRCESDADCTDSDPCTLDRCDTSSGECMQEPVDNCCVADMDCDDANRGTRDRCQDGTCTNMAVPGFCATDSDCEDEDPCTVDTCDGDVMRCSLEITEECRDETMDQCSVETERTQVMVELGAEQAVREEAARLTIVISRIEADDSLTEVRTLTVDDPNWPVRVALTPENDPLQRFHVGARVDDADGERLARLVARSNFRERRTLLMALTFDEACLGVQCAEGVTCGRGRCRPPQLIATRLPCFAGETSSGGCSATPGSGATASSQPLGLAWLGATLLGLVALRRRRR